MSYTDAQRQGFTVTLSPSRYRDEVTTACWGKNMRKKLQEKCWLVSIGEVCLTMMMTTTRMTSSLKLCLLKVKLLKLCLLKVNLLKLSFKQDRDSFETDGSGEIAEHLQSLPEKKRHSRIPIHLEAPIKAEFKSWTLKHKSQICCFDDLDHTVPRNWREWENLKKLQGWYICT